MTKTITIDPITRLEGHGKIDILLDDDGQVIDAYLQVVELRGFEKFCQGRPVEEMPRITPKICGVCPGAHHMASAKACDAVYGVEIPPAAKKLRELYLDAHIAHSHMLHFFALALPDFVPGADAPRAKRSILGVAEVIGKEAAVEVLKARGDAQRIQGIIAGHPIHPVAALPGGMAKALSEAERDDIEAKAMGMVALAEKGLDLFRDKVLGDPAHAAVVGGDVYYHETHYAGMVDDAGRVNFYDGDIRVVDPAGEEIAKFHPSEYLDHIAERVLPWSYVKVPYLKNVGWRGIVDGPESGVYRVNSLARLNVATGLATPKAQAAAEEMFAHFGGRPVHHTMAFHWARLVECLFACEEVLRLATDEEITSKDVRVVPTGKPSVGIAAVEAPRGTLYHHYETDAAGMVKAVNLVVATVQNNAAMNLSVKRAAEKCLAQGDPDEELLNRVEMAFRAYDPCLACASHALPGQMPLAVAIHQGGEVVRRMTRALS